MTSEFNEDTMNLEQPAEQPPNDGEEEGEDEMDHRMGELDDENQERVMRGCGTRTRTRTSSPTLMRRRT